jgi:Zn-finger nucleic acid-binding protein
MATPRWRAVDEGRPQHLLTSVAIRIGVEHAEADPGVGLPIEVDLPQVAGDDLEMFLRQRLAYCALGGPEQASECAIAAADGYPHLGKYRPVSRDVTAIRSAASTESGGSLVKCPLDVDVDLVMTERSGVEIDYCPSCRGVWLDRGELDKIIDRVAGEAGSAPAAAPMAPPPGPAAAPPPPRWDSSDPRYRGSGSYPSKRRSMLKDLFDF